VDFLNSKALVQAYAKEFYGARETIQKALGLEPTYSLLKKTYDEIYRKELEADSEEQMFEMQEEISRIKDIKFEFIQIFALFVVILTVVVKVVSFDYEGFHSLGFLEIITYQLAINSSWLFALVLVLALIIVLHVKRRGLS